MGAEQTGVLASLDVNFDEVQAFDDGHPGPIIKPDCIDLKTLREINIGKNRSPTELGGVKKKGASSVSIARGRFVDDGLFEPAEVSLQTSETTRRRFKCEYPPARAHEGRRDRREIANIRANIEKDHARFQKGFEHSDETAFVSARPHEALDSLLRIEEDRQTGERMTGNFQIFAVEQHMREPTLAPYWRGFEDSLNDR